MPRRYIIVILLIINALYIQSQNTAQKREFRGAWISTVYQEQYAKNTTEQNKAYINTMLDRLQSVGINAVLFQARPSADAFYDSNIEPWSRFLTDGGKAPQPYWDPLQYIIEQAHARGMELHAWLNPYRVTTNKKDKPAPGHIYHKHPERFVRYEGDGKIYFDPGVPENRKYIVDVILDIVNRYDVDGIHFDDYFYPYPANGKDFPDNKTYAKYGHGKSRGDWRRENVDLLIKDISKAIRGSQRPWVRFGISPFGIWRNKASDPKGSDTNGLQNYDDLYADVLLWAEKGWIDYLMPQLYWTLDHPRASYLKLIGWWADIVDNKCQLYIGQDVNRTMTNPDLAPSTEPNQLWHKVKLARENDAIQGNCWWPAYSLTDNVNNAATEIAQRIYPTKALVPAYPQISDKAPNPVKKIKIDGHKLIWEKDKIKNHVTDHVKYVVYRLPEVKPELIDRPEYIYKITTDNSVMILSPGVYTVTALDRANNESQPVKFFNVVLK